MSRGGFKSLLVWQKAQDLAVAIYRASQEGPLSRDYCLRDQMRRAAVSAASNIAEGDERDTDRDAVRFLFIAKGSVAELRSQLDLAVRIGSLDADTGSTLETHAEEVAKMLRGLIKARTTPPPL
ncbi:MAG: four helix bundle protein [Opitutaceae bacterium]